MRRPLRAGYDACQMAVDHVREVVEDVDATTDTRHMTA